LESTALAHSGATGAEGGLPPRLPERRRDGARAAVEAGHGGDGFSRGVEVLRAR
jgi:hypothetical protein